MYTITLIENTEVFPLQQSKNKEKKKKKRNIYYLSTDQIEIIKL